MSTDRDYRIAYQRGYNAGLRRGRSEMTVDLLMERIGSIADDAKSRDAWRALGEAIRGAFKTDTRAIEDEAGLDQTKVQGSGGPDEPDRDSRLAAIALRALSPAPGIEATEK